MGSLIASTARELRPRAGTRGPPRSPAMTPRRLARRDGGQVTAFAVVMMAALILAAGLVLDGGLKLAARAGVQAVNLTVYRAGGKLILSPGQAVADGRAYLAGIGAVGTVTVTGNTVTATVTITQDMQILDVAGLRSITVHATASAVPDFGIERISGEFANSEGPFAGNPRAGASGD